MTFKRSCAASFARASRLGRTSDESIERAAKLSALIATAVRSDQARHVADATDAGSADEQADEQADERADEQGASHGDDRGDDLGSPGDAAGRPKGGRGP